MAPDMKPYLTLRQVEIVRLISLGCTNIEMAAILGLSTSAADNHRTRVMKALGTDKNALVTRIALKHRFTNFADKLTVSEKRKSGRKNDGWN
jgi:two-component system, NarL family, response regulator NreC